MNWQSIDIKNFRSYRSHHKAIKKDRMEVTLDMPIEEYSELRRQIEAPHAIKDRRADDKKE